MEDLSVQLFPYLTFLLFIFLQMADCQGISEGGRISDNVLKELNEKYKKHGLPGITTFVNDKLSEWQRIPLNIAITGSSGTGKSSFINAIRGLTADSEGAAPVGVVETTKVPTPYSHPDNTNLKLWDLPGVGTMDFPQERYLEEIGFKKYDFFLIFSSGRFTSNDLWLANQVRTLGKRFYFIRTKVDLDIRNDLRAHPRSHSKTYVLDSIRTYTKNQLDAENFADIKMFLINNFETSAFDFCRLTISLMEDAPDLKREAVALTLTHLSEEVIREKEKYLKQRIYIVSIASAAAAAVPIPGVGTAVDIVVLSKEANFYVKQLNLDEQSLQRIALALGTDADSMKTMLNLHIKLISFTSNGILTYFASLGLTKLRDNILRITVPIIGSLLTAGLSYGTQVFCLTHLLNVLVEDAIKVNTQAEMKITAIE